MIELTS